MKQTLCKWLLALSLAICMVTSGYASHSGGWHGGGGGGWHGGNGWHGGGWNRGWGYGSGVYIGIGSVYYPGYYDDQSYSGYGYGPCGWIEGHYDGYGYWIPGHRNC